MLKKGISLLTFVLILFMVACSSSEESSTNTENSSDSSDNTEDSSTNNTSNETDSEEVKTLTLWHIETGGQMEAIENAVARFEEKHEGVKVEFVQQENDPYKTKLTVAMGGGNPPDVFHSWGGGWLKKFVDAGQVLELTGEISTDNYLPAGLSATTYNDQLYGAPLGLKVVPVWYNKSVFEEHDIEEPETYEELLSLVEKLTAEGIIPFALANQAKWPGAFYLMYFAERFGGPELFDEAYGRTGRGFDDEAYVKAGEKIQELVNMDAFPDGMNGMNFDTGQSRQLLYTGNAAMMLQTSSLLDNARNEAPQFEEDLGFFLFPSIEGGKGDRNHVVGGVSPIFSVSQSSEHPELAIELIKELTSIEAGEDYANIGGGITAVKNVEYEDEYVQQMNDVLEGAEFMQTYYDQTLPPELATVHLDTTQALFGLSITPEEAAEEVEANAKEELE